IFEDVITALAAAHHASVIHRDLKPSNIMIVTRDDGSMHAKILDFGIAKTIGNAEIQSAQLTVPGQLLGTPLYMSPEQVSGNDTSPSSDLYSLGCVMYFALAGKPPYRGHTLMETLQMHMALPIPQLTKDAHGRDVPVQITKIIGELMEKDPNLRFSSAEAVGLRLRAAVDENPKSESASTCKTEKDRPDLVFRVLTSLSIAACVIFVIFIVYAIGKPDPPGMLASKTSNESTYSITYFPETGGDSLFNNRGLRDCARESSIVKTESGYGRTIMLEHADERLKKGQLDEAISYYDNALQDNNNEVKLRAWWGLIECFVKKRDASKANDAENHYLSLLGSSKADSQKKVDFLIRVADLHKKHENRLRAKDRYEKALMLMRKIPSPENEIAEVNRKFEQLCKNE
ncbi:MAG: serine/threonine protein kinase, partial [Cyanobacteria bacterium]|nr:serine/threonine protein kinase [Cyanobacteriota bacterium]